jgi:hypothetical protein
MSPEKTKNNATKSPSHQNPPKLIIKTLTLVEFGALVSWWHLFSKSQS